MENKKRKREQGGEKGNLEAVKAYLMEEFYIAAVGEIPATEYERIPVNLGRSLIRKIEGPLLRTLVNYFSYLLTQ